MLGRYARITFTSNWGDPTYIATERIFMCDADGVKWNNETMPHTVNSEYGGNSGMYASDTTTNVWYSLVADLPVWWKVDLGAIRDIIKVKLKGNESMIDRTPKDFTVSVSDDDINWTEILSGQILYNTDEQTFDVAEPPVTSYPPVAPLTVTPHVPTVLIPVALIPVVALTINVPQITDGPPFIFTQAGIVIEDLSLFGVAYGNGVFCAVGFNAILTSPDAENWTLQTIPEGITNLMKVTWNGTVFVAVGGYDAGNPFTSEIITSPDGVTWTKRTSPAGMSFYSIAWGNGQFVAGGRLTSGAVVFVTSPTGETWTTRTVTPVIYGRVFGIAWTGSVYSAVGLTNSGEPDNYVLMMTSADGITWTDRSPSPAVLGTLRGVAWNGAALCAAGYGYPIAEPLLMTSVDGIEWTTHPTDAPDALVLGIGWVGYAFVAVGYGAQTLIMTSPDGVTWAIRELSEAYSTSLADVAWDGVGRMVAVGDTLGPEVGPFLLNARVGGELFKTFVRSIAPCASIILSGHNPTIALRRSCQPPPATLILTPRSPATIWTPNAAQLYTLQYIYLCILTGAADGQDDIIIPISSFWSVMRDGNPSYLSCVIPNSVDYTAAILARTNGDIVIKKGYKYSDGTINAEEICRVTYESLQINRGARNDSATISGHKTTTSTSSKNRALTGVSFYGLQVDGKRSCRAEPDLFLRVGDVVTYGDESIEVGQIMYIVDAWQAIMQVTEA